MKCETTRLATLCAVIDQNVRAMDRWAAEVETAMQSVSSRKSEFRDLAPAACALHIIYNGLENTFKQISRNFENQITDTAQWEKELLNKMFLEIPCVRPAVLPKSLRPHLNDLRGFRDLFRNRYDLQLDVEKLSRLVQNWRLAHPGLKEALKNFRDLLLREVERTEERRREIKPFEGVFSPELVRVLEKLSELPSPEEVLALRPSPELERQICDLIQKAREGGLTHEDERDWRIYQLFEHIVRMAKASARAKLDSADQRR